MTCVYQLHDALMYHWEQRKFSETSKNAANAHADEYPGKHPMESHRETVPHFREVRRRQTCFCEE
jgi:hypothetical protein